MSEALVTLQQVVVLRHTEPSGLFGMWGKKPVRALDGLSITLNPGETLGIIGGSGGGKSTLAEVVTLRRPIDRGRILFNGKDVSKLKGDEKKRLQKRLRIIPQNPTESLKMEETVGKQLTELLKRNEIPDPAGRIAKALAQVELDNSFLGRTPREMSGGQQQRLALARALMLNPQVIAADEPLAGVDPRLQEELIKLLKRLQQEQGFALLLISQDLRLLSRMADRVAVLHAGHLYEVGPKAQVLGDSRHPYSRRFLGLGAPMPAEEDMVGKVYQGCPWAPHCQSASAACATKPTLVEVGSGHQVACHHPGGV
ncbi:MAG TPA: ATP-binding cassette domain-containing protein [Symbiobacteriaceae bacterium]|nr:ATP-binding cassette domain-containing protein [Symbiobacteriaceae bacterium]